MQFRSGQLLPGWRTDGAGVLTVPCPPTLQESLTAHLAGELPTAAAVPRTAATVLLVRDLPDGQTEVFMQDRAPTMTFAPGAMVFPGGRVDPRDAQDVPWAGPSPEQWADRLGCTVQDARMVLSAAVRELFEEAGVLLAGPDGTDVVHDVRGDDWQVDADLLAAHELSLSELLVRRSLVLRSDLLGLCSRWLTPAFEPRRYDTWFLAAAVPEGQEPRSRTTEAVDGRWVRPVEVLHAASGGFITLLPPTAYNIGLLAEARDARQFVTTERPADQLTFTPTPGPDGSTVLSCRLPAPATPPARTS